MFKFPFLLSTLRTFHPWWLMEIQSLFFTLETAVDKTQTHQLASSFRSQDLPRWNCFDSWFPRSWMNFEPHQNDTFLFACPTSWNTHFQNSCDEFLFASVKLPINSSRCYSPFICEHNVLLWNKLIIFTTIILDYIWYSHNLEAKQKIYFLKMQLLANREFLFLVLFK